MKVPTLNEVMMKSKVNTGPTLRDRDAAQREDAGLPTFDHVKVQQWKESMQNPKTQIQLVRLLRKTRVFAETTEEFRTSIADKVIPAEFSAGQVIFRNGTPGTWMGILITGTLERLLQRQDKEISLGEIGPGSVFGDLGVFGISQTRSFTMMSLTNSVILVLTSHAFGAAIAQGGSPYSLGLFRDGSQMRNLMQDTESFLNLKCFAGLDREFVLKLREHSEPRLGYPNQVLMKENHFGDEMYILRAGTVKISKNGKFVVELPAGVVLGELAVLGSDKRRTATVTCSSLCLVRVLHADVFHEILDKFPAAKRVFDHAYIARLVSVEVNNAKEEMQGYDRFYGSASPKTTSEMQSLFGAIMKIDESSKKLVQKKTSLALPPLTPRASSIRPKSATPRNK